MAGCLVFGLYALTHQPAASGPVVNVTDGTDGSAAGSSTSVTEKLAEQQQRYDRAHARALGMLSTVEFAKKYELAQDVNVCELAVAGTVSEADPPAWNTADGKAPAVGREDQGFATLYAVFRVRASEVLKGELPSGAELSVMAYPLSGADAGPLEQGDEVLVFVHRSTGRLEGVWPKNAYFLSQMYYSVYMRLGDRYVSIVDPEITAAQDEVRALASGNGLR